MRTARAAVALGVVTAVAALAWWLARPRDERLDPDESADAGHAAPASPPALAGRPAAVPLSPAEGGAALATEGEADPTPAAPGTLVVSVVAMPDGKPVPAAQVAVSLEEGADLATRTADPSGVARFEGLAHDRVAVTARAPGRATETTWVSELSRPVERRVTVPLEPGAVLVGVVRVAGTTRAVAGASVIGRQGGSVEGMSSAYPGPPFARTTTDADGGFRVEGVPLGGIVSLDASAPGHSTTTRSLMLGEGAADHPPVEIEIAPGALVSGTVVGPDGRPVAGAEVLAIAVDDSTPLATLEARLGPWGVAMRTAASARTDADGRFEVDALAVPARYRFFARRDGIVRSALTDPPLAADAPGRHAAGAVALRRAASIVVQILDPDGAEVVDARVWVDLMGMDLVPEKGPRARFTLLPPGDYDVRVAKAPWATAVRRVTVVEGDEAEMTVRLERGVSLEGVVVDDRGTPVAGASVSASSDGDAGGGAATDAEGRFRVDGLRPGRYQVSASAQGHGRDGAEASAPGGGLRLVLRRSGTLRARLVLPTGAPPPARVQVYVEELPAGGGSGWQQAWQGGVGDGHLAGARARVTLGVAGFAPVVRELDVAPGETRDLGDVVVDQGGELVGRVVDAGGAPRAGARLRAVMHGGFDDVVATTDAHGRYRLPRLPVGTSFVRVEAEGALPGAEQVAVSAGTTTATFTLVPGVVVQGTVSRAGGGTADAGVVVFRLRGEAPLGVPRERRAPVEKGAFQLLVPTGTYDVSVERADEEVARVPEPVEAPPAQPLSIVVP